MKKPITLYILLITLIVCSCKTRKASQPEVILDQNQPEILTEKGLQNLISQKLLRIDITFGNYRNSKNDIKDGDADSEFSGIISIFNKTNEKIVLAPSMLYGENFEIIHLDVNQQVPCIGQPYPGIHDLSPPLIIAPNSVQTHITSFDNFWCFNSSNIDSKAIYQYSGSFKVFHRLFPDDYTNFLVSKKGVVKQEFDLEAHQYRYN